jgi:flagellin-specific chaperone FliS
MAEPTIARLGTEPEAMHSSRPADAGLDFREPTVPAQYEQLLTNLTRAERAWDDGDCGRNSALEEASSIVFDLLYALDFKQGGELVPRLAGLYGYIASELLAVGRSRDKTRLGHLRDMITTLRQSWYDLPENAA